MRRNRSAPAIVIPLGCALLSLLWACAPTTPIRRTAIVPAAQLPARVGAPLERGEIRIAAEANPLARIEPELDLIALPGDPGLLIPFTQLGLNLYGAPLEWLELGMQARYAHYDWMTVNVVGVLPFPESEDLWMYGFGARLNFRIADSPVSFSALLEYNLANIHQARFIWTGESQSPSQTNDPYAGYTFDGIESEHFGLPAFFVQGTVRLHPMLDAYLVGGVEQNVTNIGFDPDLSSRYESTLEGYAVGIVGLGLEFCWKYAFANLSFFLPIESEEMLVFGPSFALQIGASLNKDDEEGR
ncbi:MAG: hypothetical protein JW797_17645 [Bradymonadales bacterium]|nr:hypothetical protein [Bradymonadales bacterium]